MTHQTQSIISKSLLLKSLGLFFLLFFFYISACLLHATFTDFVPQGVSELEIEGNTSTSLIKDSTLTFTSWNIGYGGLGKESNFFYNGGGFFTSGGKMVRSPQNLVEKNVAGMLQAVGEYKSDFILLQEVDFNSCRSYHINQKESIQKLLPKYSCTSAINFDVNRIPTPILEPWSAYGEANSGLNTFSVYTPSQAERHQLPGKFSWPSRLFLLDRCLALHRYPTAWDKDLVVIHVHNSAYDHDGSIKKLQMDYLKNIVLKEYEAGNYVVVGGDWNQCPPGFAFDTFHPGREQFSSNPNVAEDYLPEGWNWAYDAKVPTIRNSAVIYEAGTTFTSLIDYFLVSPNIELLQVQGVDQGFDFSDHHPITMAVQLK